MSGNHELNLVKESKWIQGYRNLLRKENYFWWGSNRWWINALVWSIILCGLVAALLFGQNYEVVEAANSEIESAGGIAAYTVLISIDVFFQFGIAVVAIGTIILMQNQIIGEKHNGVSEWILSKPVTRPAYILAKLTANALPIMLLLVALPSMIGYGLFSIRLNGPINPLPFLSAVGIMALHTLFYLTLTLMLGTLFNSRGPILAFALGSALGGGVLGGLIDQLNYVTPWTLPRMASMAANGKVISSTYGYLPLIATYLWCVAFILIAVAKFRRTEF